ncbi:hypothetical protein MAH1_21100 [Sessilibacter sp. MAH1]
MRSNIPIESRDLFKLRLAEKDAQREELFGNPNSQDFKSYIEQQVHKKPKRLSIGKPAFAPKF